MIFSSGLPETACGWGSTLDATAHLRGHLPLLLERLGVRTLVDAPCGDFNWLSRVSLPTIDYIGVDIGPAHLRHAGLRSHGMRSAGFVRLDLLSDPLPPADAVLSRDFLQHVPTEAALGFVRRVIASGAKWLIATSHLDGRNDQDVHLGGFRPLDLSRPPFSFPEPFALIEDPPGTTRRLGAWACGSIDKVIP